MDASAFDPNSFLDATVEQASTKRDPLPAGREFIAEIGEPKSRKWTGKADPTKSGIAVDIPLTFLTSELPPDVQEKYKGPDGSMIEKFSITDGIMLDLTENGAIDLAPGKNGKLRLYREATNLNAPGQPFSIRMLQGRRVLVKIRHELYEGNIFDKAERVAKI